MADQRPDGRVLPFRQRATGAPATAAEPLAVGARVLWPASHIKTNFRRCVGTVVEVKGVDLFAFAPDVPFGPGFDRFDVGGSELEAVSAAPNPSHVLHELTP